MNASKQQMQFFLMQKLAVTVGYLLFYIWGHLEFDCIYDIFSN